LIHEPGKMWSNGSGAIMRKASLAVTAIFGRIQARGLDYWADPFHQQPGRTNDHDGGRGVYWEDPNGHNLEIITVPYGG